MSKIKINADVLYGFSNSLLAKNFDGRQPTPQFHMELWDLVCDDHPKVAIAAPRGFAKTTAVTHTVSLAFVLFKIRDHVLIVSDTEAQAINFLRDIKNELLENDLIKSLFGFKCLRKDRETEIIGEFEDGNQFRIVAKGSGQKVRGIKWRNKRPNLIIGDDLENEETTANEETRMKFIQWVYNALLPAGSDDCLYRIVGTILHFDSFLERLMPKLNAETTVVEPLRQYSNDPAAVWKSYRYRAHDEDYTHLLWPEKWPKEKLEAIRQDYISQGFPEGYSQEYLNYPLDPSKAMFRKEDIRPIPTDAEELEEFYVAVDLAISQKDTRAYSVFAVVGVNSQGKIRVRKMIRERMDALDIVETFFSLHKAYKPEVFFVESENIARTLGSVLKREMEVRNIYLNIENMLPQHDKVRRARPLQAMMRAGAVEFDTTASWYPSLVTEFTQFPVGPYKDQVDALSWIPLGLQKIQNAPTPKERAEQEYQEMQEDMEDYTQGRSGTTGY